MRAILKGLTCGEHGLPLIGSGDWNDGMNMVGEHGRGESVWLGFFLYDVLMQFAKVARMRGDLSFAERCQSEAARLRQNIEQHGWDGEWYRRAYFDDGSPLGSASNPECQIDSIAQSWSVLSGAGDATRSRMAMEAVYRRLVRRDACADPTVGSAVRQVPFESRLYQRAMSRGCEKMAGNIRMGRSGPPWPSPRWVTAARMGTVRHDQPGQPCESPEGIATYKVEPYVVAADVYAVSPHTGRGGWTWYTGSAGWMYRLIVESLLGLRLEAEQTAICSLPSCGLEGLQITLPIPGNHLPHHGTANAATEIGDDA